MSGYDKKEKEKKSKNAFLTFPLSKRYNKGIKKKNPSQDKKNLGNDIPNSNAAKITNNTT